MSNSTFWLLVVGAYLVGSIPSAYLVGRRACGIDIRQHGSGNVGATNLMRFASRRDVVPVIVFDTVKGLGMVVAAWGLGVGVVGQTVVGLAAICGHNWPVFLRFRGGRGVITTMGVAFIIPLVNSLVPREVWLLVVAGYGALAVLSASFKRLPLGVFCIVATFPLVGWGLTGLNSLGLGYLVMFAVLAVRRLTAPQPLRITSISRRQALLNRLLYDRDIKEKEVWTSLVLEEQQKQEKRERLVSDRK